jgi:raffinose/stachyose/melibiose transport system permease protein
VTTVLEPARRTPAPPPAVTPPARTPVAAFRELLQVRAFAIPLLLVFAVLFAYPLVQSLYWSFTDFGGYSTEVSFVGLDNYAAIFTDPSMIAGLGFTILFTLGTTVLVTVIAIPAAVVLNRAFLGRNFVRSVFFFPSIPSVAILGLVWGFILSPLGSGALNSLLRSTLGIGPVPWLSDSALAQLSVIVVGVWSTAGWHAILYLAYLQSIPADLYEVATVDGASALQKFRHITVPLLTPALTISCLLLMTSGLKVYELPFTLTSGGPGFSTNTITQTIIQNGISQAQFGRASALAVVFMLLVGAIVAVQLLLSNRLERRTS